MTRGQAWLLVAVGSLVLVLAGMIATGLGSGVDGAVAIGVGVAGWVVFLCMVIADSTEPEETE